MTNIFISVLFMSSVYQMPIGISPDTVQLHILVKTTQKQIEELKKLIHSTDLNAKALKKIEDHTRRLSQGLDTELQLYQNDPAYQKALLKLQTKDEFLRTYEDIEKTKEISSSFNPRQKSFLDIKEFQKNSVLSNLGSARKQSEISEVLKSAPPGAIRKIDSEISLEQWKTSRLISLQLTELLATLHAIREEQRLDRGLVESSDSLGKMFKTWESPKSD